jgi:hypothetical protein
MAEAERKFGEEGAGEVVVEVVEVDVMDVVVVGGVSRGVYNCPLLRGASVLGSTSSRCS